MIRPRITTFSNYYKKKYGTRIGKIVVDTGTVCPNRALGGCIFCTRDAFSPDYVGDNLPVSIQIEQGKKSLKRTKCRKYFIYFQQETCTAPPFANLLVNIASLSKDEDCVGVILSTRPDYLPAELIKEIAALIRASGKECLFELGLQSAHNRSLQVLHRNHSVADVIDAVEKIRSYDLFSIGVHLMFGIPGETKEDMIATVRYVSELGVDAVKMHHLQILRDTPLHEMYRENKVVLFALEEYIHLLTLLIPHLESTIVVHRLWATSHPHLLVGPKWNISATKLRTMLDRKLQEDNVWQGMEYSSTILR